jgi:endonuclease YncB( thermonuclease family)
MLRLFDDFKRIVLLGFFVILPFFAGCGQDKPQERKPESTTNANAKVVVAEVYDGDTFVMSDGRKVRIAGIDTPENGEKFHNEAKAYLSGLIIGKEITLLPIPAGKDRYERTLAEVFIDTINVGIMMIRRGYAQLYLFGDDSYLKDNYLPYLKEAMHQKIGIWGLQPPKPENYYIRIKGSYRFHRPLCPNLKEANPKNLRRINTRLECLEEGLSPCRNCRP